MAVAHCPSDSADAARSRPVPIKRRHQRVAAFTLRLLVVVLFTLPLLMVTPAAAAPSPWRWPLDGTPRILRRFAPPPAPWLAGHRGVDLAATPGTPVLAAGGGTISYAGPLAGRGVVTILHAGGLRTTYLPVQASVRRGDTVSAGTRIGTLEDSRVHCERCLHWGLLRQTRYLDPLLLLGWGHVRLLPYWPAQPHPPSPQAPPPTLPRTALAQHLPSARTPTHHSIAPNTPTPQQTPTPASTASEAADQAPAWQSVAALDPRTSPVSVAASLAIASLTLIHTRLRNRRRRHRHRPECGRSHE